ncbi:MAG: hypothetical protein FWD19_02860 [Defluviitaleaceae bacterium]|nr:hypothetical protein [Defluviitaleaceae bacterium]
MTAPAFEEPPVTTPPIGGGAQWNATIAWFNNATNAPVGVEFAENTVYRAKIIINPQDGWTMTGVANPGFSVLGASSVTRTDNVVTAVFPATAEFSTPPTGINDIVWYLVAMFALVVVSAALWGYLLRQRFSVK